MHSHDMKWIDEQLLLLPDSMRANIRAKYNARYNEVREQHKGEIAEENLARRECNLRLLEVVEKYGSAYHGNVISPPTARI